MWTLLPYKSQPQIIRKTNVAHNPATKNRFHHSQFFCAQCRRMRLKIEDPSYQKRLDRYSMCYGPGPSLFLHMHPRSYKYPPPAYLLLVMRVTIASLRILSRICGDHIPGDHLQ